MTLSLKSNSKVEILRELLLDKTRKLKDGQRLPTVKEIMEDHKVSQATVVKALDHLKQKGYIEATVGRGIFPKRPVRTAKRVTRVDMILFGAQENFCVPTFHNNLAVHLQSELKQRDGWLHITVLPRNASWCDFVDAFDRLDSEAVLLMAPCNADIYKTVVRRHVPFLCMFPNFSFADMTNTIQIDNLAAARLWVQYLKELGHRKIAHVHSADTEAYSRDHHQRLLYFYQEMAAADLMVDPQLVVNGGFTPEESYQATQELIGRDREFTAVICGDDNAAGVYEALQEEGLSIPEDVSVIGIDGKEDDSLRPLLTTLSQSPESFAELVIERFDHMFSNRLQTIDNILTVPKLQVMESTRAL